ncbi:unnamed protein product [Phyllotreta striolata]|uniref:Phenoloxidase-activating factor 2 n=1 Tax=Phyllotreta striolata TaxID=444603 RepID=A0A9P0DKB6_PHYSR|nr:unnamed protein product [Phyllotreta striolata]
MKSLFLFLLSLPSFGSQVLDAQNHWKCICVPENMCADSDYGDDNLDVRLEESTCENYFDVCCENPINDIPKQPPTDAKLFKGCGLKNPIGLSGRITSDSQLAQFGELPWTVVIMERNLLKPDTNMYRCGGSVIHPQVVVTAAHCVIGIDQTLLTVRAGEWDTKSLDEPIPHQDASVGEALIHPNFHSRSLRNDIALLFLAAPLELRENVGVICLPPQGFSLDSAMCTAGGWGKDTFKRGKHSSILKKVDLPLVERSRCLTALKKTRLGAFYKLHSSFICAGGEENKDTCKGDGGSPLVCPVPGGPGRFFQMGIVSWGIGCGDSDTPGVYVNVPAFSNWIDMQLIARSLDPSVYKFGIF